MEEKKGSCAKRRREIGWKGAGEVDSHLRSRFRRDILFQALGLTMSFREYI